MNKSYHIGELARELNLNKETIRYYEKIGLLSDPKRDTNGYRNYTQGDLQMLLCIRTAKEHGFTLSEIKMIIMKLYEDSKDCDIKHLKKMIVNKIETIDIKLEELNRTKRLLEEINKNILPE
ncbi:MAG: putative transcriptional regulator [Lachnospiraceae bacterium]|jgi:MerR family Zn(II)-responsive transcriptional regulator of zntA|nr:putative transcriptional regulator [Lachnospiraceae bacterium]